MRQKSQNCSFLWARWSIAVKQRPIRAERRFLLRFWHRYPLIHYPLSWYDVVVQEQKSACGRYGVSNAAHSGSKYRKDRGTRHEAPSLPLPNAERAPLPWTLRPADRLRQETRSQARFLRAVRTIHVGEGSMMTASSPRSMTRRTPSPTNTARNIPTSVTFRSWRPTRWTPPNREKRPTLSTWRSHGRAIGTTAC